ncbi:MAG: FAD-binding protein [Romboutsia sp.]|uniref:FAD-binding protein n=1 Tax=Romboutsia sp. TaxID=1965302 RepID=UPI003F2EFFFD
MVYCENSYDVSEIILYSRKHNIPIRVRCGGHNYEGYSSDTGIDISKIIAIILNKDYNIQLQVNLD